VAIDSTNPFGCQDSINCLAFQIVGDYRAHQATVFVGLAWIIRSNHFSKSLLVFGSNLDFLKVFQQRDCGAPQNGPLEQFEFRVLDVAHVRSPVALLEMNVCAAIP
jgi:hypothetical protein